MNSAWIRRRKWTRPEAVNAVALAREITFSKVKNLRPMKIYLALDPIAGVTKVTPHCPPRRE